MGTIIREPCLCSECKYWIHYNLFAQIDGKLGECTKGKSTTADMFKCDEFIYFKEEDFEQLCLW